MSHTVKGAELHVGTAGWSYEDWKGIVYPQPQPRGFRPLAYLSHYFNTVELNNTFYRPPKADYCHRWLQDVSENADFHFTAKLWQRFTHERAEGWRREEAQVFRDGMAPLVDSGRLGALLMQFPWSFRFNEESKGWVSRLVDEFEDMPLVLEVRSRGWLQPQALDFVRSLGIGFCNIDQPQFRGNIPLTSYGFGSVGYLRLHGRNREAWFKKEAGRDQRYDYMYAERELSEIQDAAEQIARQVQQLYVIANNHYRGQAPANALQLFQRLTGESTSPPEELARHYDL